MNKGKWNESEVAKLCECLDKGMEVDEIAKVFEGMRTLSQIKSKMKSKSIVERNVDIDIDEAQEDIEKEEVMEEQLEKVKDVLDEKIAEVKKNNNKNLFRLLLLAAIIVGGLIQTGVIE